MKNNRANRLGEEIKKIINELQIDGFKDPRLYTMFSITAVEVSADGSYATCYVSLLNLGSDSNLCKELQDDVISGLQSAKGMIKREIGHNIKLRRIPELIFKIDNSMEYGNKIDSIIKELK